MPENQNETPTLDSIVGEMEKIGNLSNVLSGYNRTKDVRVEANLLDIATRILSNGAEPGSDEYDEQLLELEGDKASTNIKIKGSIGARVGEISETYNACKEQITDEIVSNLNGSLEGVGDAIDAYGKVAYEFLPVFAEKIPQISQEEADRQAKQDFKIRNKMPIATKIHRGNPNKLMDLRYRELVSDYIDEQGEEGQRTYSVNRDKMRELVENPVYGSILYTAQPPQQQAQGE